MSSSTPPVPTNMVMMSQGQAQLHHQQQQQQQQNVNSMAMASQNLNMIGSEMQQGAYQQMTYTTTNYASPMPTTNVQQQQQQPQQHQGLMQSVFQAQAQQQQQQQQQILAERVGDIPRNGSSDLATKLSEHGMSFDQSARGAGQPALASVGAEQYQMVTTTTSVSGTVVNVGDHAPIDNNGTPRQNVGSSGMSHGNTG